MGRQAGGRKKESKPPLWSYTHRPRRGGRNLGSSDPLILVAARKDVNPTFPDAPSGIKEGCSHFAFCHFLPGYIHLSNANGEPVLLGMFSCTGCDLPEKEPPPLSFPCVSGTCDQWFLPVIFLPESGSGVHSSVTLDPR